MYNDDDNNKIQDSLIYLKNVVIGSDRQKTIVISQGIVPRLMFLLSQDSTPLPIRYDAAIVLGEYDKTMDVSSAPGKTVIRFEFIYNDFLFLNCLCVCVSVQVHCQRDPMIMCDH